jgi:hypothetical protein
VQDSRESLGNKVDFFGDNAELDDSCSTLTKWTDWEERADEDFVCGELCQTKREYFVNCESMNIKDEDAHCEGHADSPEDVADDQGGIQDGRRR